MWKHAAMGATAGLALAACAGPPALGVKQDVDFMRGCWVAKDAPGGRVTGFLRLLSPEPEADVLAGFSQTVSGSMVRNRFGFTLARNGSQLAIAYPDGSTTIYRRQPDDAATGGAVFAAEGAGRVILSGGDDRIDIRPDDGGPALFSGERDGCD
jgi:hypothetical protein